MDFMDYVNRGTEFYQEGKLDQALEDFEAALKLQDNEDFRKMVEMVRMAIASKSEAAQHAANEAEHWAAHFGITDVDKTIAECTESLKRNPNDASAKDLLGYAYYIRGVTFTSKGEHARSIEDYNEAIKCIPDYAGAFNKRGQANHEIGNYDQAIKDYEKLVQLSPPDYEHPKIALADAYCARGMEYDKKSDYAHAISDYEMALKINPDNNASRELLEMAKANKP